MHRNIWCFLLVILDIYLTTVVCDEKVENSLGAVEGRTQSGSTELLDEARRRHHHLFRLWGWHALAIAYWIKVKLVIVAFFVGSAIFLGLRYYWPQKCATEVVHGGPIIYDHPSSFAHHDTIPYSLSHSGPSSFSSSGSFEPYSAYSPYSDILSDGPPSDIHTINRRSANLQKASPEPDHQHHTKPEEQIGEFMLAFLGLDSKACRRRFICEMEFRSRGNPLTRMAFRIVGQSFFEKYTNSRNELGQASSFGECAVVNSECVFIEQNVEDESTEEHRTSSGTDEEHNSGPLDLEGGHQVEEENVLENSVVDDEEFEKSEDQEHQLSSRRRTNGDR